MNSLIKEYETTVKNKYELFNSLFLNLPFPGIKNIGILIPLLQQFCLNGLSSKKNPVEIMESFFKTHTSVRTEKEKVDFMLKIIQYIERQVVLFDAIEESAFNKLKELENDLSIEDYINVASNKTKKSLYKKLSEFSIRLVFTAHPTQFYSQSVLDIINKLRSSIRDNDITSTDKIIQQLGLTSLINTEKPTPLDEAKNIIYFLRNVYYDASAELYSTIKKIDPNIILKNPSLIQLGFWPGGDRDGNPFVMTDTTVKVADELRMTLMKCYYADVKKLEQKLTFRNVENLIQKLKEYLYFGMFDPGYKVSFSFIFNTVTEIQSILGNQYNSLYSEEVDELLVKIRMFKTHFASIDIRQNHSIHKKLIEQIFISENIIKNRIDELNEKELVEILLNYKPELHNLSTEDPVLLDTIDMIQNIKSIQSKNGEQGCNRYIISNSEDIFSVLFVFSLLIWNNNNKKNITVDIIPLFETMEGMKNAEAVMEKLFSIPQYREHIQSRNNIQTIMLGFSDGTKDGGYLKANWSIFKTKEILSKVCKKYGIKAIFFDGRGGPPARGGGKTHKFYASQSNLIADNAIQLTIQGQTISSKFGTKEHFKHNCEQMITAGLAHNLYSNQNIISTRSRILLDRLSELSFKKYNALKNHKLFIPYLEKKSTLSYYGKTKIGSRPVSRKNNNKLELHNLRAIPFVGSWSQLKQNIPGFYGIGTSIKTLVNEGKLPELKRLYNDVPFFKALLLNSMMSLSKSNFELTRYISKDRKFGNFWKILFKEYELSKKMLLLVSGYEELMEEEQITKSSIDIREKIVLPLLMIQQYSLQKIEKKPENKNIYEKLVKRSLYGNINASRNSV